MKAPVLTVAMLVYNGERYLKESVESTLSQTFTDFELIVINDGSTDSSAQIVETFTDDRIRFVNNDGNKGIPYSRNLALELARGEFLTWTDCDDINLPTRFEKQVKFLKQNSQFGVCGTWLRRFGEENTYINKADSNPDLLKATLLFRPSVPNATAMLRMAEIRKLGLKYNVELPIAEDFDFISRCSQHFPLTNIQKVLYLYRASETSIMKKFENDELASYKVHKILYKQTLLLLGMQPSEQELELHNLCCSLKKIESFADFMACYKWLMQLLQQNEEARIYKNKALKNAVANQFYFVSKKAAHFGLVTLKYYLVNSISSLRFVKLENMLKLTRRCLLKYNKL